VLLIAIGVQAQQQESSQHAGATRLGKNSFVANCAGCHGLDGRGSDRAPDIATAGEVHRLTDAALLKIVRDGVSGTGMPPFRALGEPRVRTIIGYLRALQGASRDQPLPGDPANGKALFYGKGDCSRCHVVRGVGGFIGSDLTGYAAGRSADQARQGILNPELTRNGANTLVIVTTRDGRKLSGIARNEDNFSLQLLTLEGAFYSLSKSESQIERTMQPIMPTDYGSGLSPEELNDLVSYLISIARESTGRTSPPKPKTR
jgi:putative heme-binding domain-containing protein